MKTSDRAPAYWDPVLHFDVLRLAVLHEGDRIEESLATEERENAYARTCALTPSPRSSLLLEYSLQPTDSPLCELA